MDRDFDHVSAVTSEGGGKLGFDGETILVQIGRMVRSIGILNTL